MAEPSFLPLPPIAGTGRSQVKVSWLWFGSWPQEETVSPLKAFSCTYTLVSQTV